MSRLLGEASGGAGRRTDTLGPFSSEQIHDPQFEADVEALYAAGTIRLMSGDKAGGGSFYEAMLVPSVEATEVGEAAESSEAMPIPVD